MCSARGALCSWMKQLWVLYTRAVTTQLRNPSDICGRIFVTTSVGVVTGLVFFNLPDDPASAFQRLCALFFAILTCARTSCITPSTMAGCCWLFALLGCSLRAPSQISSCQDGSELLRLDVDLSMDLVPWCSQKYAPCRYMLLPFCYMSFYVANRKFFHEEIAAKLYHPTAYYLANISAGGRAWINA